MTAQLVGPIDFPDIADNGFADSVGDPAYYDLGPGINDNVEARWYGDIMIPGTGTAPVPINFATTSDDGSMLYIDGNAVVDNNNFQGATQATGLVDLTPGLHTIDVEYYQGGGGASLDVQWDPTGGTNFVDIPNSAFGEPVNSLTKTGTGTLTLSNTNTYLGSTTIDAGTLVVTTNGVHRTGHGYGHRRQCRRRPWPLPRASTIRPRNRSRLADLARRRQRRHREHQRNEHLCHPRHLVRDGDDRLRRRHHDSRRQYLRGLQLAHGGRIRHDHDQWQRELPGRERQPWRAAAPSISPAVSIWARRVTWSMPAPAQDDDQRCDQRHGHLCRARQ